MPSRNINRILCIALCISLCGVILPLVSHAGIKVRAYDPTAKKPEPILFTEHVLAKGESLVSLAKKNRVKVDDILKASGLKSAKQVKVGTRVKIPTQEALALAANPINYPPVIASSKELGIDTSSKPVIITPGEPSVPAPSSKEPIIKNADQVPDAIRQEFHAYAKRWIDTSEKLGVGTETTKQVEKEGGKFIAYYQRIRKETVQSEVRKRDYDDTPYVGHVTYEVDTFRSIGDTEKQALAGPYTPKVEYMREIFSYDRKKKAWR